MSTLDLPTDALTRLRRLPLSLKQRIRGQDAALDHLVESICRRELETFPPHGPRGVHILAGPTGVGKTESAKLLAHNLFGPHRFMRFDCSEFKTEAARAVLLGNRTGDQGRLGEAYERVPVGIWLFDEIEKGDRYQLPQLFLQQCDAGCVTLSDGRTLDLSGIYLLLTTNLGSAEILERPNLTFTSLERHVTRSLEKWMSPELMGRFGKPVVYRPLTREVQRQIATDQLQRLLDWQRQKGRQVTAGPGALELLIRLGFSPRLGARPLINVSEELVGNAVSINLLDGGTGSGTLVVVGDRLKLVP